MNLTNWIIIVLLIGITIYLYKMMPIETFNPTNTTNNQITNVKYQYDTNSVVVYGYLESKDTGTQNPIKLTLNCSHPNNTIDKKIDQQINIYEQGFFSAKMNMKLDRNKNNTISCSLSLDENKSNERELFVPKREKTNIIFQKYNKCRTDGTHTSIVGSTKPTYNDLPNISQIYSDDNSPMNLDDLYNQVSTPNENIYKLNIIDDDNKSMNNEIRELLNQFK